MPGCLSFQRVPLVVEFCVKEMEEHGLEVEGIYR